MSKSQLNILIVEDDPTQGRALREALLREGYSATLVASSTEGLIKTQETEFHALIVDCMLPKMNGVDMVEEIVKLIPRRPKVILVSGIFKDRQFIKDAIKRLDAEAYFLKPIDLPRLLDIVDAALEPLLITNITPSAELYTANEFNQESLQKLIDQDGAIHGFHLPKLYQRLQETPLTGDLTLISAEGGMSTVSFYQGRIFAVHTQDRDSYFGSLAVSNGFVLPEDVLEALEDKSSKRLGQKLIDSLSLSPHAIQVILEGQLALRLSQTIANEVLTLQWQTQKFPEPEFNLAENRFEQLLEDWMDSKFSEDWIKSTFMQWGPFLLAGDFHARIKESRTVEDVFSDELFDDKTDTTAAFHALLKGQAFLSGRGERTEDFAFLESRINRMTNDYKEKNFFQFFGLNEKAKSREINRAYLSLKDVFSIENLPGNCPPELTAKCSALCQHIEKAFATLNDESKRQTYLLHLQNRRSQFLIEAEPIFRAGILELINGQAKEAEKKFQSLLDRKLEIKDLKSYRIWAGLKSSRSYDGLRLDQIPPEERHSAPYLMARGVWHRSRGQYKKAIEDFRTAQVLEPRMSVANVELKSLVHELQKNKTQNRAILREATAIATNIIGRKNRAG